MIDSNSEIGMDSVQCRPIQIFRYTLSPGTSLKSSGQVRTYSGQAPLLYPPPKTEISMLSPVLETPGIPVTGTPSMS